jgi:phosphate transport system substrate-binding protein
MTRHARALLWSLAVVTACGGDRGAASSTSGARIDLTGAGATFPFPLYRQWFADYAGRTGVQINYLSVGSDEGLRLLDSAQVDFGATERPLALTERAGGSCGRVAIPTVAGAVAVVYRLPGLTSTLRFDAPLLVAIFGGRVTRWDAPAIQALNPGVRLPAQPITVVHRAGGSGTSRAFAAFLATGGWPRAHGDSADVRWPVGVAVEGNEGIAGQVQATLGSIGYLELAYARINRLPAGTVRNTAGAFVAPSLASVAAALVAPPAGVADTAAYPIVTRTWLVVDPSRVAVEKGERLSAFLRWALADGATQARALEYAPLPPVQVAHYDSLVRALTFGPCPAPR